MKPPVRVWILPNRNTIGLAALVLAIWYAGASQTNGAAYLLCFTLISVALVSVIHAWANLRGLSVAPGVIRPVFAGEERRVPLVVHGAARRGHAGIRVRARGGRAVLVGEVLADHPQRLEIGVITTHRGCFAGVSIELSSVFPLGFFTASMRIAVQQIHYVYPKPDGRLPLPHSLTAGREHRSGLRIEGDDFAGVRPYRRGESQRHIDWKAVARGQPMLVKQWAGQADETVLLEWRQLATLEPEARLSQLTRWVVVAERRGMRYSLRLPGLDIAPSRGEPHMHECLRALAAFPA